jgi:hypothetical protein
MTGLKAIKIISDAIVAVGINQIVSGVVATNVPRGNIAQRSCVWVGKQVITSMLSEKASEHTDKQIEAAINFWKEAPNDKETTEESA